MTTSIALTTVIPPDAEIDKVQSDLYQIEKIVSQKTRKATEVEILELFAGNNDYASAAQTIATAAVRTAYENNPFGLFTYQHPYYSAKQIQIARLSFSRL